MGTTEHNTEVLRTRTYVYEGGLDTWKHWKEDEKEPEVLTMPDFVDLCNKSSRKIKTTEMKVNDFYKFSDGHRCRQVRR